MEYISLVQGPEILGHWIADSQNYMQFKFQTHSFRDILDQDVGNIQAEKGNLVGFPV